MLGPRHAGPVPDLRVIQDVVCAFLAQTRAQAERRHQEHVRWPTRNGKPADARILRTEVRSSSPHGREPSQTLAVTLAIDREEGGAIIVEACLSFPISRVGKLHTSERLPVFFNP